MTKEQECVECGETYDEFLHKCPKCGDVVCDYCTKEHEEKRHEEDE